MLSIVGICFRKLQQAIKWFYLNDYCYILLLVTSLFLSFSYFQFAQPSHYAPNLDQQLLLLEGKEPHFSEANNTGYSLILFNTHKLIPADYPYLIKAWQFICLVAFLIIIYKITYSLRLTLLVFGYAPFLINSFISEFPLAVLLYTAALYFYITRRKFLSFLTAFPLVLIRHEGLAIFFAFFIYEFFINKAYSSVKNFVLYIKKNILYVVMAFLAGVLYMYLQFVFFGHPLANFMLNTTQHIALNFPWHTYLIRILIFVAMFLTSLILFRYSKLLFTINTLLFIIYLYFGLFGFEYTFFAVQVYFGWMFVYTTLAVGFLSGDLNMQSPLRNFK